MSLNKAKTNRPFALVFAIGCFASLLACSNDKMSQISSSQEAVNAKPATQANPKTACAPHEISGVLRQDGVAVDLERETLPKGLFIAGQSDLLIEKRGEHPAHVLIREIPGGKEAEIKCGENVDNLGFGFDLAMTGPVKFKTTASSWGSEFVLRQFFFYQNRNGYGVVLSSPRPLNPVTDLRRVLRNGAIPGQLVRLSERRYAVRFVNERDNGVRATLVIQLDLI